jgi:hypothetical protein
MPNLDRSPANGMQGSSYLYDMGTTPNTRTAVSQKVRILTPSYGEASTLNQMGVVSSFSPTQSRTVEPVRGVGFGDMIAELVPSITAEMTASLERTLLYLCNLWQATGYAAGIDGPVRSLRHHRWPFDIEQQLVFSSLVDADLDRQNEGVIASSLPDFQKGVKAIEFPMVTEDGNKYPGKKRGHSAIITIYEACWFTDWSVTNISKDAGMLMETGSVMISDVHDFSSVYGEFLATGNDPTIGQLGSIRFAEQGRTIAQAGRGAGGGGTQSLFVTGDLNATAT